MAEEADPTCAGITDPGAKQVMHEMYVDFMNAAPGGKDHGMFLNMKSAFLHAEEENFQQALKRIGRENAIRLENIMSAVQQQGYGSDAADLFYMKWAARSAKNTKTSNNTRATESQPVRLRESQVEAFREAVEESSEGGAQDIVGFSYELTQGLLADIEAPIELYFVHPAMTNEELQEARQQGAEAIALPCPVVAGCTMDLNVALVAAGEDGVVFQRKFSKEQIVGGYGLSVGFKGAEFEYEKEIMVLADEVNGPDDAHLVFDLTGEVYDDPNETPDAAQEAVEDGTTDSSGAPGNVVSESFPLQEGEAVDQEGASEEPTENQDPEQSSDGISLSVADSHYGKLATIETAVAGDWLKTLRNSPEGERMAANSKQRVMAAMAQNKALAEKLGGISPDEETGEGEEVDQEDPEQKNSPEPQEE
jgi:hypothetical protein